MVDSVYSSEIYPEVTPLNTPTALENNSNATAFERIRLTGDECIRAHYGLTPCDGWVTYRSDGIMVTLDKTSSNLEQRQKILNQILNFLNGEIIGRGRNLEYQIQIPPYKTFKTLRLKIDALQKTFPGASAQPILLQYEDYIPEPHVGKCIFSNWNYLVFLLPAILITWFCIRQAKRTQKRWLKIVMILLLIIAVLFGLLLMLALSLSIYRCFYPLPDL